jgi:pimeloyl-ACP methyl ester carboxylesterase
MMSDLPDPSRIETARMDDGAEILLRRFANAGKPRLAITHGNGFAIDGYRVFWEPLLADFDVVLFDMRNHGRNPPAGGDGHNYRQFARDVATLRSEIDRAFGARPVAGVFHSMSARSAMKQAAENVAAWDALVLFDPPNVPPLGHPCYAPMKRFEEKLIQYSLNRPDRFGSVEEAIAIYSDNKGTRSWVSGAAAEMARAIIRPCDEPDAAFELACRGEFEATIYLGALLLDLWPGADTLGCPSILIGADPEKDPNAPTAKTNKALADEGGYRYMAIAGTGHMLQLERPEECRAAMLAFLGEFGFA